MDRDLVIDLIPCLVCGDLPPEVAAAVRSAVEGDEELMGLVEDLTLSRDECLALLDTQAPLDLRGWVDDAPTISGAERPLRPAQPLSWIPWVLAASILFAVAGWVWGQDPMQPYAQVHHTAAQHTAGWLAAEDPRALERAFLDAGAPPETAMVGVGPEASLMGGELIPGSAGATGTVIVFEVQGQVFRCQVYRDHAPPRAPDQTLHDPAGRGPDLMLYQLDEVTTVLWSDGEHLCVLSTEGDPDALLAMAKMKVWGQV